MSRFAAGRGGPALDPSLLFTLWRGRIDLKKLLFLLKPFSYMSEVPDMYCWNDLSAIVYLW